MYNIIFTAYPIIWYAIFDFEFPKSSLYRLPQLYRIGPENRSFSKKRFWFYIFYGSVMGLFILVVVEYTFEKESLDPYGLPASLWIVGIIIYSQVVIMVNVQIAFKTNLHTVWSALIQIFSVGSFFLVYWITSTTEQSMQLQHTFGRIWELP